MPRQLECTRVKTNGSADRGYDIDFGSPKDNKLSLVHLGERAYDHLLLLPPKSKGWAI